MNLNQNPCLNDLRALLACANDDAGHHVLWVDTGGQVHVTVLDVTIDLPRFAISLPNVRLRFETYCVGHGYVGQEAAADREFVEDLFRQLELEWSKASSLVGGEIFID